MTKPVTRALAVNCLLERIIMQFGQPLKCPGCGEPLLPEQQIQFDHTHADVHGGGHTYHDIRPLHYDPCHKQKTKKDVAANAKVKRIRGETKGRPKRQWRSRPLRSSNRFKTHQQ